VNEREERSKQKRDKMTQERSNNTFEEMTGKNLGRSVSYKRGLFI
jgi:hypothetical protein